MQIIEIRNTTCSGNNPAYIEKTRMMSSKDGLSCNVKKKSNNFEQAVISYINNMESTLITIGYDSKIQEAVEFEGSTLFSFPNTDNIKISYMPLKSKTGYANSEISCGKLSVRTLKSD